MHLADVRDLLNRALRVQEASLAYLAAVALALVGFRRGAGARTLARWATAAAVAMLALFAVLGLLAVGDFSTFWTQFHLLSFENNLWMLDWETDYMIRFWPPDFWFRAVLDVVLRSAGAAVVLLVFAQLYLRLGARPRPATAPSPA